ncbi:CerR family C-terminal domain-containing protein [Pseudovibrio sp. SPO723]|uniref:CerR family C-terminal domain-containing protein n=1 Tax=Nesiotobacter zosterae TaxID=392721 RepID=UPI0029C1C570|nr:CerR family C-terminal domain-containing protein [Pseudovibrio sp. SPO723]MDX5592890.1 CerR family C-terminal domain-containing protein [Pseudovibrio sp. SPO723]
MDTDRLSNAAADPAQTQHLNLGTAEALLNPTSASDRTKVALIEAALQAFTKNGYAATSTREIASLAEANIAAISYHFGGKEGLRDACSVFIVAVMRQALIQHLHGYMEELTTSTPEEAEQQLLQQLERMVFFVLLDPKARLFVRFLIMEMASPSAVVDHVYSNLIEPAHKAICQLFARASGWGAEEERTRLAVFTFVGQIFYFRMTQDVILQRLDWESLTPVEAKKLATAVTFNLRATLALARSEAEDD